MQICQKLSQEELGDQSTQEVVSYGKEQFFEAFNADLYMRALDGYVFVTTLSVPKDASFVEKVRDESSDLPRVAKQLFTKSDFEHSVGAYKLALVQEPDNEELKAGLAEAEEKHQALQKVKAERQEAASEGLEIKIERGHKEFDKRAFTEACKIYQAVLQDDMVSQQLRDAVSAKVDGTRAEFGKE
eukprot:SAG22_NODE_10030_length_557_cov_0.901747_1_plen_185_part_11